MSAPIRNPTRNEVDQRWLWHDAAGYGRTNQSVVVAFSPAGGFVLLGGNTPADVAGWYSVDQVCLYERLPAADTESELHRLLRHQAVAHRDRLEARPTLPEAKP